MKRGAKPKERTTPVGKRLFTLREEQGLTLDQAAERWGISKASLARYETGLDFLPSKAAIRIARVEGVTLDWLFAMDERRVR